MSRRILQGLREIAAHLGLHGQRTNRLVLSWITREGLPARRLAGRWYAEVAELRQSSEQILQPNRQACFDAQHLTKPLADLVADCLDVILSRCYRRSRAHPLSLFLLSRSKHPDGERDVNAIG